MKNKSYILLSLITLGILLSCKKNDDSLDATSILGTWEFALVSGGMNNINISYNPGDAIWIFKENGNLSVQNNILSTGPEQIFSKFETGIYSYTIETDSGTKYLFVENVSLGSILIENNILLIDDGIAVDGYITELHR